jgi:hypothetical protein
MSDDSFPQEQESWDERLRRITNETRALIVASRDLIARSRASLRLADERLKMQRRP